MNVLDWFYYNSWLSSLKSIELIDKSNNDLLILFIPLTLLHKRGAVVTLSCYIYNDRRRY